MHVCYFKLKEKVCVFAFGILSATQTSARIPCSGDWPLKSRGSISNGLTDGSESQPDSSGKVGLSSQ